MEGRVIYVPKGFQLAGLAGPLTTSEKRGSAPL